MGRVGESGIIKAGRRVRNSYFGDPASFFH